MALTKEQSARILEAVRLKVPHTPCRVCQSDKERVVVTSGIALVPVQMNLDQRAEDGTVSIGVALAKQLLPSIAIICQHCGHTEFYNVNAMGLGDLLGHRGSESDAKTEETAQPAEASRD